jgi:hypothetical protein
MLNAYLTKHYALKTYEGVDVKIHVFSTSELDGNDWSASLAGLLIPGARSNHWI